jgi:hypothetical protein
MPHGLKEGGTIMGMAIPPELTPATSFLIHVYCKGDALLFCFELSGLFVYWYIVLS